MECTISPNLDQIHLPENFTFDSAFDLNFDKLISDILSQDWSWTPQESGHWGPELRTPYL